MPERTSAIQAGTRRTVVTAGLANLAVLLIKAVAGVLSGSSAMLAEAAHSAADTLNQGFLLASLKRSQRPADDEHPFGYGQERYFWSLLAAFGIFVAGAGFSVFEGVLALSKGGSSHDVVIAYAVLAAAGVAEGISFARALRQMRGEARTRRVSLAEHVRTSPDTTVKAALFEDTVAMAGLVLAAAGVGLRELTGSAIWDGAASIAIGALLIVVAIRLGLDSRDLLIGRAADPKELAAIRHEIETTPGVTDLVELQTMHLGPDHLIVAARISLDDSIDADGAENLADRLDRRLAKILPQAPHVFIDPTQHRPERQESTT
ncbi:MAG TPA: cation diffusion facilitator family transporter [Streptosporangiaceae bacterium]|nr:cation diffusion facilitator family transporter [Streptosporangiaceae bacterium]